jgi:glycosyltransferase involved in cell wall biosynthesis
MISAVLIVKNEADKLEGCLKGLKFCDEIIVVDSQSMDETRDIARRFTPHVYTRTFDHFAAQKNFAISKATSPWILSLDADEELSADLREEICESVLKNPAINAFSLPRKNIIFGKVLKFGASSHDYPVRLFRRGKAQFEGMIHERLTVEGEVQRLKSPLWHHSTTSAKRYLAKLNQYSTLEAESMAQKASFNPLKMTIKPVMRFFHQYVLKGGFRDGLQGFTFAFLSGYYEFIRYAKLWSVSDSLSDKMKR